MHGHQNQFIIILSTADPTLNRKNLLICLNAVDNWKMLGLQLDIPSDELIKFEGANQGNPDLCKETMLNYWLCKKENPSWMTLVSALEDMDLPIPANKIRTKYLQVYKRIKFFSVMLCILSTEFTCTLHYFKWKPAN